MIDGVPWVTYFQVTIVGNGPQLVIQTAHLSDDGASWVHVPVGSRSSFNDFDNPAIAAVAGRPVVALADRNGGATHRMRVFRLNDAGTGYDELGGGPASGSSGDASRASVADIGGTPWVSWAERSGQSGGQLVRTARLNGSSWQQVGSAANDSGGHDAGVGPALASVNGFPWVAFGESDQQTPGGQNQPGMLQPGAREPPGADLRRARCPGRATRRPRCCRGSRAPTGFVPGELHIRAAGRRGGAERRGHARVRSRHGVPSDKRAVAVDALRLPRADDGRHAAAADRARHVRHERGGRGTGTAATPKPAATNVFGARLLVAILDHAASVRGGHRFTLRYVVTDDVTATLRIRRNGRTVRRIVRKVAAGRHAFLWTARTGARRAPRGATRSR